ncbi:hypothetical protein [Peribacillus sp. SCS-155]|uniref:hypothetical protein n=1 Tax=Peribacillus sedimenti TaxID=3115297 RepID=UPI003905FCD9
MRGIQLFFRMDIGVCDPFARENESTSQIWVEPEETSYVMEDHELSLLILKEAMDLYSSLQYTELLKLRL